MNNKKEITQIPIYFLLTLLLALTSNETINAQSLEFSLSSGVHLSKYDLVHDRVISEGAEGDFGRTDKEINADFVLGIAAPLYQQLYLRTEIGYSQTNTFLSTTYNYDEGFNGLERGILLSWLNNQKLYWSLLPEYRWAGKHHSIFLNAGPLLYTNIINGYSSTLVSQTFNFNHPRDYTPWGIKVGLGGVFWIKQIGFSAQVGYMRFSKSQLLNDYRPYIRYQHLTAALGVVYRIQKS
jgi:hypothetical protein